MNVALYEAPWTTLATKNVKTATAILAALLREVRTIVVPAVLSRDMATLSDGVWNTALGYWHAAPEPWNTNRVIRLACMTAPIVYSKKAMFEL